MWRLLLSTVCFVFLNILGITNVNAQVDLPYSINFAESQEGWTAVDKSTEPGTTWVYKERGLYFNGTYAPCVMIVEYSANSNDYYISPALNLKANTKYTISTIACGEQTGQYGSEVSLAIGTSKEDMGTFKEIKKLALPFYPQNTESEKTELTVETDGVYYIAFHATTVADNGSSYLSGFSISAEEGVDPGPDPNQPATLPYEINFKESANGWTPMDNNKDGTTWQSYSGMGVALGMALSSHDDDFISPGFSLESGKQYRLTMLVELSDGSPSPTEQLLLMGGQDKAAFEKIKELSLVKFGENPDEYIFTPAASGIYYFAFRNLSESFGATLILCNFAISEVNSDPDPSKPVLSTDFSGENPLNDWTVLDANTDKVTWAVVGGLSGVTYNSENAANDWLITPALSLTEGWDYLIKYTFAQSGAFEEDKVEIRMGATATAEGLSELLVTELIDLGSGTKSGSYRLSCMQTGNVYLGFHLVAPVENGSLSLTKVEVVAVEKAIPLSVTDLKVTSDYKAKSVTLKWTNPLLDTTGAPITSSLKATVYENDVLVKTLNDLVAGATAECTYSPAIPFTGNVVYAVKAVIGDIESKAVSASVCLDDVQGDTIPVQTFNLDDKDAFNLWTIIDKNGGKTWTYASWDKCASLSGGVYDDWLISTAVKLASDKRYVVIYDLRTSRDFPADLDITIGKAKTIEGQTTVLSSHKGLKGDTYVEFTTRQFSVDADGEYYVGLHAGNVDNYLSIKNIRICYIGEKEKPVPVMELPYTQNFDSAAEMPAEWKADGNTGAYGFQVVDVDDYLGLPNVHAHTLPNAMFAMGAPYSREEYIYTPKFAFRQGIEYTVEFWLQMPGQNGKKNSLNVFVATAPVKDNIIGNPLYEVNDGSISEWEKQSFTFMPETEGEYCFIIKVTCPLTNAGNILIDDFSVTEKIVSATPAAPTDFRAGASMLNRSVALNWTNPTVDVDGQALPSGAEVTTKLYENNSLLNEQTGKAGQGMGYTCNYSEQDYEGQKIYKIVSYIRDIEGAANTCLVDISSCSDGLLQELAFVSDFTTPDAWTVIDQDNDTKKWTIDATEKTAYTDGNDEWLITPAVTLEKGKTYYMTCELQTNENAGADVAFTMGNGRKVENQTTVISDYKSLTLKDFGLLEIGTSFVAEDNEVYLGVHVTNNTGKVTVKSIQLMRLFERTEPESLPYRQDFEDRDNLDGITGFTNKWGRRTVSSSLFNISEMPEGTVSAFSGKYVALAKEFDLGARWELLYTPMFNMEKGKSYKVTYYLYMPGNGDKKTVASVFASPMQEDPGVTLTELQRVDNTVTKWTMFTFIYKAEEDLPYCFYFRFDSAEKNAGIVAFDDFSIEEDKTSGIMNDDKKQVDMYYNAAISVLTVPQNFNSLMIYDGQGRLVANLEVEGTTVDLSMLGKGFYYVQAQSMQGECVALKIVR